MNDMHFVLVLALCAFSCLAEAKKEDRQKCINDLVDWCNKQNYSNAGNSTWTSTETINGEVVRLVCVTNKSGTKCTKNGNPWFTCSPDHTATYKGTVLRKNSPNGADYEVCYAASKITSIPTIAGGINPKNENRQRCVNDLVGWCNNQDYTNVGESVVSIRETVNGQPVHIKCTTNKSGTSCTKNGDIWFTCSPSHTATYKETVLHRNSLNGADFEICYAASKITTIQLTRGETKEDRQRCINDIVDWCRKQDYSNADDSEETTTLVINGKTVNTYCKTNSSGKACLKDDYPWYSCSRDHTTYYKNTKLRKNAPDGADDEICFTASHVTSNG